MRGALRIKLLYMLGSSLHWFRHQKNQLDPVLCWHVNSGTRVLYGPLYRLSNGLTIQDGMESTARIWRRWEERFLT